MSRFNNPRRPDTIIFVALMMEWKEPMPQYSRFGSLLALLNIIIKPNINWECNKSFTLF